MKICHFIASSKFGGAERVVINLCNELSKRHEVHLISFADRKTFLGLSERVHLHTIEEFKRYNIVALVALSRLIRRIDPDIVHTHGAKASRIVHTIRRRLDAMFVATKHNARKGTIFNRLNRVIAVSKRVKQSIAHEHVEVIYNGIAVESVAPRHRRDDDVLTLLAVGRLDKIKGFDKLIEACATLSFPFRLHIVGEGEEKKHLQTLIDRLGLQDKVCLCGFCKDIAHRMAHSDIVVISSHSEGFSLVMVEALFYAPLLLSTRVGGAVEILSESFITNHQAMGRKLEEIAEDYERYEREFEELARRQRDRFRIEHMARAHEDYYRRVMKGRG